MEKVVMIDAGINDTRVAAVRVALEEVMGVVEETVIEGCEWR